VQENNNLKQFMRGRYRSLAMSDVSSSSADETAEVDGSSTPLLHNNPECNGSALSSHITVSSVVHCRKLDKTVEAVSLISVRALLVLVLWYLFSFGAIFLNKYVVDMLNAEMIIFCKCFWHSDASDNVTQIHEFSVWSCSVKFWRAVILLWIFKYRHLYALGAIVHFRNFCLLVLLLGRYVTNVAKRSISV